MINMTWKDIIKGNKPRPPFYDIKEKRRTQDELFDEANRNMRKLKDKDLAKDFTKFRREIFSFFAKKNYAQEDLDKFKESPALKNLHMMYGRMRGD